MSVRSWTKGSLNLVLGFGSGASDLISWLSIGLNDFSTGHNFSVARIGALSKVTPHGGLDCYVTLPSLSSNIFHIL